MERFNGFTDKDFDVFTIPGLEERMEVLRSQVSPKLEAIAAELAPDVTALTGDEMFVHVAKHARRTKNPPEDTWAALANNNRGYKKLPHFQIGLWETHVFVWFAVIYESPVKQDFAKAIKKEDNQIRKEIPEDFVWSIDHTKPDALPQKELTDEKFSEMVDRLENVKKAELLCGLNIDRNDPILKDADKFLARCKATFETLEPLYRMAKQA
ncbi:UPF0637 protein YktB [Thalassobacillus devorans]|uniref:UPF0637 protein GCM10007216_08420 n=1 Tax=Thalassobacillus devorans TaxID=279813 RepID=A0ABQ1NLN9_9BACI|nr:DUF1054 domain-containing protein [Thalassobacillus devorans]NIK27754.1 uncharacterized protein YktB (UPF0637 family) [Thalassobacillus devorans]GGC80208.1 UPF0637 protein YktB [Thalassobacillus devorans]